MKKTVLAVALFPLFSFAAYAADLPNAKDPPAFAPPPPAFSWTGFYGGLNAGVGWSDENSNTVVPGPPNTLVTAPFEGSTAWGTSLPGSSRLGFVGGGQIGYNWQFSEFVVGAETDFQYDGGGASNNSTFAPIPTVSVTNAVRSSTPWFGTARVRLGTTAINPALLIYATGGFAYGREYADDYMAAVNPVGVIESFPFSTAATKAGWTIGGGLEWRFAPNWSVKAEYLYVNLGANAGQTLANTNFSQGGTPTDVMRFDPGRDILNIARVGVNYQFDMFAPPGAVAAKY